MECELCRKESHSLLRVNHRDRGRIKICSDCYESEKKRLIHTGGCSCCG